MELSYKYVSVFEIVALYLTLPNRLALMLTCKAIFNKIASSAIWINFAKELYYMSKKESKTDYIKLYNDMTKLNKYFMIQNIRDIYSESYCAARIYHFGRSHHFCYKLWDLVTMCSEEIASFLHIIAFLKNKDNVFEKLMEFHADIYAILKHSKYKKIRQLIYIRGVCTLNVAIDIPLKALLARGYNMTHDVINSIKSKYDINRPGQLFTEFRILDAQHHYFKSSYVINDDIYISVPEFNNDYHICMYEMNKLCKAPVIPITARNAAMQFNEVYLLIKRSIGISEINMNKILIWLGNIVYRHEFNPPI